MRAVGDLEWAHAPGVARILIAGGALVLTVGLLHFVWLDWAPPGFFVDEAAVWWDASGIALDGRDRHDQAWPLFFQDFGEWRDPAFVYAVALVFRVFSPGIVAQRATASAFALTTAVLLGLLAWRLSGRRWLGLGAFAVAGVTPWLFKIGRLGFEPSSLPAFVAAFLYLWHRAHISGRPWEAGAAGVVIGLSLYTYPTAWLLSPLTCLALAASELPRVRWRLLLPAALGAAAAAAPMAWFMRAHPGALLGRFEVISVFQGQPSWPELLNRIGRVYLSDVSPGYLFQSTFFTQGGELFALLAAPIVVGLVVLWRRRGDAFARLLALELVLAPLPAALTMDFSHELRNLQLAPILLTLAALGTAEAWPWLARQPAVTVALTGLLVFQAVFFLSDYFTAVPNRMADWQGTAMNQATQEARQYAQGRPIFVSTGIQGGDQLVAYWSGEDVQSYRRGGIAAADVYQVDAAQPIRQSGVLLTMPQERPPEARYLQPVMLAYRDDWGHSAERPEYLLWATGG